MFGVEEASHPHGTDHRVVGTTLVTNQTLDLKIDVLRHELRTEMTQLRSELRTEMTGTPDPTCAPRMTELRAGLQIEMSGLSSSVDRRLRAQTWMMMSTMIAAIGLSATISRL